MKRSIAIIAIISQICAIPFAQEQLGIRTGNYGGANSLLLNPANSLTLPLAWDANLLEFGFFFATNYGFVEQFRLLDARRRFDNVELRPLLKQDGQPASPGALVLDFYENNQKKRGVLLTQITGPALLIRLGESYAAGFFTRARTALNISNVPPSLGYYEYTNHPFEQSLLVEPFAGSILSWSEIGFNYAHFTETGYGEISFGASLKILQGYEAVYIRNNTSFNLIQLRGGILQGANVDFSYGFASTGLESNQWRLQRNGAGIGLDAGLVITTNELGGKGYRFKFGAALLDIGGIRFARAAQQHAIQTEGIRRMALNEYNFISGVGDLDSILKTFSRQLLDKPDASLQSNHFMMWLPAGLSLQADWQMRPGYFLNATWVQSLPIGNTALRRSSVLAITPRIEHRWLELALPLSLLDWRQPRAGLAARLGFFWLGTDDFRSVFQQANFDRADFYIAVKANPFRIGASENAAAGWGGKSGKSSRARNSRNLPCPKF